ncbi:hypothetical protein KC360_g68 [Hortaea werneckii]|nr:hypothetical protein KC344_g64 [Hortaea werneckii]KAI7180362.1 hypothetical protein KC360_g68 [Hortaea werneckii]
MAGLGGLARPRLILIDLKGSGQGLISRLSFPIYKCAVRGMSLCQSSLSVIPKRRLGRILLLLESSHHSIPEKL